MLGMSPLPNRWDVLPDTFGVSLLFFAAVIALATQTCWIASAENLDLEFKNGYLEVIQKCLVLKQKQNWWKNFCFKQRFPEQDLYKINSFFLLF